MIIAKARLIIMIAALLAISRDATAQKELSVSPQHMGEFDCVVEAKTMIKLGSPDTGIIEALKVDRDTTVKKGEVVAQLDSNLQRIALELAQLKASNEGDINSERTRLAFRSSEAERAENLNSKQIVTTKVRDEAVTERNLAALALAKAELEHKMAQVDLEQARARLDRRSIRSPINGVVSDVTIRLGEYVYEQTPLVTIAEINPLYVKVFVPVRYYHQLHVGTDAEVMPEEPIGGTYKAKVTVVDRVFDTASSTFGVRLELPNSDYTLPAGMRCRIRFLAQEAIAR
jgi:membrane fusion protein, multidrug efflux system